MQNTVTGLTVFLSTILTSSSFPQSPYFDFQAFPVQPVEHYHKSAPLYHKPEPVYHKPEPVYHKPAPLYHKPEPIYHKPKPAYSKPQPAPAYQRPAPVYHKPAPVYHKPAPVYHKPAPVYHKPAPLYKSAGPPYHHTPSYTPHVPHVYAKHPTTYIKPAPLPTFVNLGPGSGLYQETSTAPAEEEAPADLVEDLADVVDVRESDKSSGGGKPEKLVVAIPDKNNEGSQKMTMTKEELIEIAVERLKEMEELKEDGLVVLEPQSSGDIIPVDDEAAVDELIIVEFESERF